ncbi:DUF3592 domain-containing protein [Streptomyces sp. NBC_00259]|uniref:DUF3592 domain-containing protein n=1 Tax=Streptomyces sp. NBC_00259 TaxID=2903643 RepID=UPI002E2AAFCF|nr:DUF3592 domain-containing protein [Streptomyces sp. NBC_00259]
MDAVQIVFAGFTVLGGLVALLAGAYGLNRTRRISAAGQVVTALVKAAPPGADRPLLQYETADGRVLEVPAPAPPTRGLPLTPGSTVRISYDPDDPREIVLSGHERTRIDRGFMIVGAIVLLTGLTLAVTAR